MPEFTIKDTESQALPVEVSLTQTRGQVHIRLDGIFVAWLDQGDGRLWHTMLSSSSINELAAKGIKIVNDKIGGNPHWDTIGTDF